jgi:DNA-directed RNA polymerase subunit RPC12/RpoP
MRIVFGCDRCGHTFKVGARYAGKQARCKHCGNNLTVPPAAPPRQEAAEPAADLGGADLAAAVRDVAEQVRQVSAELAQTRRLLFRLVFWPMVIFVLLSVAGGIYMMAEQRRMMQQLEKSAGGSGDLEQLLRGLMPK